MRKWNQILWGLIMNICKIFCISAIAITLGACTTIPTKPVLGGGQSLTSDGYLKSKQGNFVVQVQKIDTSLVEYRDIAKYGLPVRLVVANFSQSPINFSAQNVSLYKNGKLSKPLTASRLEEIKNGQHKRNAAWNFAQVALATAAGITGAMSGDMSVAQSSAELAENHINLASKSHEATKKFNEEKMDALSHQLQETLLKPVVLKQKEVTTGIVYFENIKNDDLVTLVVKTGPVDHHITYQK